MMYSFRAPLYVLVVAGLLVLVSCRGAEGLLPEETADEIPWESDLVILESETPPDSLYQLLKQEFDSRNFNFEEENPSERFLSTEPKSIGQRVVLAAQGNIASSNEGSELTLKGLVGDEEASDALESVTGAEGGTGEGERRAAWFRAGNQPRGYAVLVQVAQSLPGTVRYEEE